MASSLAALSLLVIAPAAERGLDVVLLPSLGAAAEQDGAPECYLSEYGGF